MPINPSSITLEPNQTQQFTQSGLISPVWTLDGVGSLNQFGLYAAPATHGAALVRVHTPFWNYVNLAFFDKNSDDSLTKNTSASGYYTQAKSAGQLKQAGDYVEFTIARTNPYWTGLENDAVTHRLIISAFSGGEIREYHPAGDLISGTIVFSIGDLCKMTILAGGQIEIRRNGTVVYTTVRTYENQNLRFVQDGELPTGTVIKVPKMQASNYTEFQAAVTVSPPILTTRQGLEAYYQADTLALANNAAVENFADLSGKGRHLTAKTSDYPLFKTAGNYIQFNGSTNSALANNALFPVTCGFMVAKYDDPLFPVAPDGFKGLLSDLTSLDIFVGNANTNKFFDFGWELHEFRFDERIYPDSDAPAPMQNWRLLFFRFWKGMMMEGVQIGQQRSLSARKWKGGVKFLALYSQNFTEEEIRKNAESLANHYAITLADVFPYQPDANGVDENGSQTVNFYDPPEGDRISETISEAKRILEMTFSGADQSEVKELKSFFKSHYEQALPFITRDYRFTPPEDIEGYFNSQYNLTGSYPEWKYSFKFREK